MDTKNETIEGAAPTNPLSSQVGGNHYREGGIQPVQYIEANRLGFLEGCVIKRVTRHSRKGGKGRQDIEKAIHELQLLLELRYADDTKTAPSESAEPKESKSEMTSGRVHGAKTWARIVDDFATGGKYKPVSMWPSPPYRSEHYFPGRPETNSSNPGQKPEERYQPPRYKLGDRVVIKGAVATITGRSDLFPDVWQVKMDHRNGQFNYRETEMQPLTAQTAKAPETDLNI